MSRAWRAGHNRHPCPGGSLPFSSSCTATLNADTYPRQPGIDALHYVFRLGLSDRSNEITGETTMTVRFLRDGVAELNLDLTSLSVASGMIVQSVRRGGSDRRSRSGLGQPRLHSLHQSPACGAAAAIKGRTGIHIHDSLPRHARRGPAHRREHARRADVLRRELAQPRSQLAADDRSPVRQGHG